MQKLTTTRTSVVIGRFQPLHSAHTVIIGSACKSTDKLLVLVGSANAAVSPKNPFTFAERKKLIEEYLETIPNTPEYEILPINDYMYNDNRWVAEVVSTIETRKAPKSAVTIFGSKKDDSTYYLSLFPQYSYRDMQVLSQGVGNTPISATGIRKNWLSGNSWANTPYNVTNFLVAYSRSSKFSELVEEYEFIENYKAKWAGSPFPPTFVTVDACVVQSGHILLVKRKGFPYRGFWALPGGFLDQGETLLDGVIRELREETGLKVPEKVLAGSVQAVKVFDHPERSARGRTITHCYYIKLDDSQKLPRLKAGSDAKFAAWVPLGDVLDEEHGTITASAMMEDHWHIIKNMID